MRHLFGRISRPSTASPGVELWISSLRASRANPSPSLASVLVTEMSGTFGPTLFASLAKSGRPLSFSKTCRDSSLLLSPSVKDATAVRKCGRRLSWSPPTFRDWVTTWRRFCSRLLRLGQRTEGNGCSSWPTASTMDLKNPNPRTLREGAAAEDNLSRRSLMWRTPADQEPGVSPERLEGGDGHRAYDKETGRLAQYGLTQQTAMWKTPHGMANEDESGKKGGAGGGEFALQANQWRTPSVPCGGRNRKATEREPGARSLELNEQIRTFPSSLPAPPTAEDGDTSLSDGPGSPQQWGTPRVTTNSGIGEDLENKKHRLEDQAYGWTGKKRLNSLFVSWLMGFPLQWFLASLPCGCQEMRAFLNRSRAHLCSLLERC